MIQFSDWHIQLDGVLYHCTRDSGQPVYHALAELVGIYVEVVPMG